jgi:hypothetical protein
MSKRADKTTPTQANAEAPPAGLSADDQRHLASLQKKFALVRDRTRSVAMGLATGFFLHGEGGVGKSHEVLGELKQLKAHFVVFNSRMTGRGLYNALEKFPDAVHVLEDMEQVTRDRGAQGALRSALWGQRRDGDTGVVERLVTWSTSLMLHSFIFTGGIIMTSNRPLHDLPELNAVKTRIAVMHLQASDPELRALMRSVALRGYEHEGRQLAAAKCSEIAEYIIEQSLALHRSLDMRLLTNSFQDYLLWEDGESACHWRDLVATRLRERPTAFREEVVVGGRAARKQQELAIVREIMALTEDRLERLRLWQERTGGKGQATMYRRMGELDGS